MRRPILLAVLAAVPACTQPTRAPQPTVAPPKSEPAAPAVQRATPVLPPDRAAPQRPIGTAQRVADPALADEFNNLSSDGDIYFAGWPSEAGLRTLAARGVKTVIALKTPEQVMDARGYDPRAVAKELGIAYVVIPVTPDSYDAAVLDRFAAAFDGSAGPILIHCGSSSTVGGVWSGYLAAKRGVPSDQALDRGRAAGLREGPMTDAAERVIGSTGSQPKK